MGFAAISADSTRLCNDWVTESCKSRASRLRSCIAAACMLVFLDLNGIEPTFGPVELFEWTMEAAIGAVKREQLAERLRRHSRRRPKTRR